MDKIKIDLKNCYGIGKLKSTFNFTKSNTFLVYAPNGTMKSSLAKSMAFFADRDLDHPRDRFYPERTPLYDFYIDGNKSDSNANILIVDPETTDYDSTQKISTFIASKELKRKYDAIYQKLDFRKKDFIKKLKKVSQSNDCESEFVTTYRSDDKDTFFDLLSKIISLLDNQAKLFEFRYNDIFDKKNNIKKFLDKNQDILDQYISSYQSLISKSSFFNGSDNSFGTYQAGEILKSISDDSFFEAGHGIELSGKIRINSSSELKDVIRKEIENIVSDEELKTIFNKVDKAIGSNAELRAFKKVIEKDNLLLVELKDYEGFRRKVWIGYFAQLKEEVFELCEYFDSQKASLKEIFDKAGKEVGIWKKLIGTFNSRFHVPFEVALENQEDIILKEEGANLSFLHKGRANFQKECDEKTLLDTLSKGEQRAYYILQILFDVESRRIDTKKTLVVFDDIADSFDYKNKYAIIEYIKDLRESDKFNMLILTHNFDFYRTVASRLGLRRGDGAVLMAIKNEDAEITLLQGQYVNDAFKHLSDHITNPKVFITLLPFLRNLVNYTEDENGDDYALLTKCLHIKQDSDSISANDILNIWKTRFGRYQSTQIAFGEDKVIKMICDQADSIISEGSSLNKIILENKVVLSVAIRLKSEKFMIASITDINLDEIDSNQTRKLFDAYKESVSAESSSVQILDKVVLMTPENIHLNAFMYEPLIDISVEHLIELYKDVNSL